MKIQKRSEKRNGVFVLMEMENIKIEKIGCNLANHPCIEN